MKSLLDLDTPLKNYVGLLLVVQDLMLWRPDIVPYILHSTRVCSERNIRPYCVVSPLFIRSDNIVVALSIWVLMKWCTNAVNHADANVGLR